MIIANVRDKTTDTAPFQPITLVAYNSTARDSVSYVAPAPGTASVGINLYPRVLGAGIYTVEVRVSGYQLWIRPLVQVGEDHCGHTNAARLDVSLEPL